MIRRSSRRRSGPSVWSWTLNAFQGELKYEGTNEIDIDLFKVAFKPGKSLNTISDEWGNIEIEGEALADATGKFGTTMREQVTGP